VIERILTSIAKWLLGLALSWARRELAKAKKIRDDDATAEENARRYHEAKTREEEIRRALDLLGGTAP